MPPGECFVDRLPRQARDKSNAPATAPQQTEHTAPHCLLFSFLLVFFLFAQGLLGSAVAMGGCGWRWRQGGHQLLLPPIQLSQVLRPASWFKPAAQHIQSIDHQSSNQCIDPANQSISRSVESINHSSASLSLTQSISISRSVQLINHSSASLSLTQSIHPLLLPARYQSIDRSVMPINRSIIHQSIRSTLIDRPGHCNRSVSRPIKQRRSISPIDHHQPEYDEIDD